jgi:hypothetical protein
MKPFGAGRLRMPINSCSRPKLEHRAKKWEPVFRKSDATTNNKSKMPLQNERILLWNQ